MSDEETKKPSRGRTIAVKEMARDSRRAKEKSAEDAYPSDVVRPKTRGDCVDGIRPCPFVSCSQHLYLDVNQETGAIKLNFPHLEVWEMDDSCALDVADRGGITLEEVGEITNLTRERIRQVEVNGLAKIKDYLPVLSGCPHCSGQVDVINETATEDGEDVARKLYYCKECDRYL